MDVPTNSDFFVFVLFELHASSDSRDVASGLTLFYHSCVQDYEYELRRLFYY